MQRAEKVLYHQIHPLKLAVDWVTAFASLYFFWQHKVILGVLILLIPPILASILLIRFAELEKYKQSAFGRYVAFHMTKLMQGIRLFGMFVMVFGAWQHQPFIIVGGLVIILLAWGQGLLRR